MGKKWHGFHYHHHHRLNPHYGKGIYHGVDWTHHRGKLTAAKIHKIMNSEVPWVKKRWISSDNINWAVNTQGVAGVSLFVNAAQAATNNGSTNVVQGNRFVQCPTISWDSSTAITGTAGDIDEFFKFENGGAFPATNADNIRMEFEYVQLEGQFLNHCNNTIFVKIYEFKFRQSRNGYITGLGVPPQPLDQIATPQGMLYQSLVSDGFAPANSVTTPPDFTPFDSPTFCTNVKILRTHRFKLGPGENRTLFLRPSHLKRGKEIKFSELIENASNPHSRHLLILAHGAPSHDKQGSNGVMSGSGFCDIIWKTKFKGRSIINTQTGLVPKVSLVNNLHAITGGLATNEEVEPGNAQNPTTAGN